MKILSSLLSLVAIFSFSACTNSTPVQETKSEDKSPQKVQNLAKADLHQQHEGISKDSPAKEIHWLSDFDEAKRLAKEQDRSILVNFSGSDWCYWCIKLDGEVFSQKAFREYAENNLVLLLVDFPNRKKLPARQVEQNDKLAKEYGVQGFPTVLVLSAEGKLTARTGYRPGGAQTYVKHLRKITKRQ